MASGIARDVGGPSSGVTPQPDAHGGFFARCSCGKYFQDTPGKHFCSRRCKDRAYNLAHPVVRQSILPLEPAPALQPPTADQRLTKAEEGKLRGDNALVLRRLRSGPATTAQLQEAAPRSMAVHSRVADVRTYLRGLGETVLRRRVGDRLHLYWIGPVEAEMRQLRGRA